MFMYQPGDIVQPRLGGQKLRVIEVHSDQIVGIPLEDENGEKITLKAADVTLYRKSAEAGDG
jgi:hypothetical protein